MANPVEQLAALCVQAMNPNTELVRSAVAELNKGLKNPQSIMVFLALLQTNPNAHIQQFAAVVLRKRVAGLYMRLARPDQRNFTNSLIAILADPKYSVVVLRSVVDVAVTLGKAVVPRSDWPEFLPFVLAAVSAPASPEQRSLAMYMLTQVLESLGDKLRGHYHTLHTLLAEALRDPTPAIRSDAMRATSMIIPWLVTKEEIAQYSTLIPMIVDVLRHFLTTGDDEEAIETFSILGDLVETPIPVITKYIPALVNLMLETSTKTEIDFQVRQSALSFVQLVVSVKPKLIVKHKLVTPILAAAFTMCAEGEGNDETKQEKEEEEESMSPHVFGAQLIDSLALALPVKQVVGPALSFVAQYGRPEMHFRQRRAAVTAVTVLTEGCAEAIKDTLATVVPFVVGALVDPSFLVRQSACLAIGQCADNLQPEIIEYHGTIIPALLQGLRDSKDSVVHRCCYALEAFCETLGDRIVPYLAPFMDNMGVVMRKDTEIQEMAISAISSTSVAAGKQFAPYFPAVYELLRSMMMATGLGSADPDKILVLRARATECVGLCALAVGDAAKGVVQEAMTLALSGLELEFAELNEFTFGFFCNIAELLKGEFANFLPTVMPHVWKACQSTDGIIPAAQQQGLEIEGDEDDDIDVSVRTSFLDEKSAACQAIGSFANHVRAQFIPYVDQSIQILNPLLRYFHETVRASALESIQLIACAIHDAFPPAAPYKNGDLSIPLSTQSYEYSVRVLPVFISALKDKSPDVVTRANDSIGEIAQLLGPVAINEFVPAIKDEFLSILQQQAPCQTKFTEGDELEDSDDEYDEEQEEEEEDDDSRFLSLLDNVTECMVDLAHALGTLFVPYMDALFPLLMKYSRKSAHHSLRSTSIGAMAETINGANALPSSPEMITQLCQLGLMGLTNSGADPDIQRTSAFLCGVLVELGGNNMESFVLQILQGIHPLYSSADPTVIDNACGAVARIVTAFPNSPHVPLEHILPILLPCLPIKRDHQEDEPVWKCVGMLLRHPKIVGAGEGAVGAVLGAVVKAVEQQPPLEETVLARLRSDITAALPLLQPVVAQSNALSPLLQAITSKLNVQ